MQNSNATGKILRHPVKLGQIYQAEWTKLAKQYGSYKIYDKKNEALKYYNSEDVKAAQLSWQRVSIREYLYHIENVKCHTFELI